MKKQTGGIFPPVSERCGMMAFGSISFLLYFFPLFLLIYALTPEKYRKYVLIGGSVYFYTAGIRKKEQVILFCILIAGNLFLGYRVGTDTGRGSGKGKKGRNKDRKKERDRELAAGKKVWLITGIVVNLGVLVFYKMGLSRGRLPLGISFYTFQNLSYLIDVYRNTTQRESSPANYFAYMLFFPKVGSGPITRYGQLRYQMEKLKTDAGKLQAGLKLFILGLGYKVLLADTIGAVWFDAQSIGYESLSTAFAWIAAIAYSMRLYFDFYGYSLMAAGLGKMLGVELPENFREPYMSRGVRDFYRRWHITLGEWFRDYVYIPLGGSRRGEFITIRNLFAVWLLTALWHGLSWNFLIWGGLLFCLIAAERLMGRLSCTKNLIVLPRLYLWTVIPVTWMCFAIPDVKELMVYLGRMTGVFPGINVRNGDWLKIVSEYKFFFLAGFLACTPLVRKFYGKFEEKWWFQLIMAALFWLCVQKISIGGNNPFMYFRF